MYLGRKSMSWINVTLYARLKMSRIAELKKFGITMGSAFLAIAFFILLKAKHDPKAFFIISAVFFSVGLICPLLLKPVYIFWMGLGHVLGWVNTRLILIVIFYLVFTPIGIVLKILRIDLLEEKLYNKQNSYWKKREAKNFLQEDYQRQF